MPEMFSWYIDNRFYITEEFVKKLILYSKEANVESIKLRDVFERHEPEAGNPSSPVTFARNVGLLNADDALSDSAMLYQSGFMPFENLLFELIAKRNVAKDKDIKMKPVVILSIVFSIMDRINIAPEERFITTAECYEYLSVLASYSEITETLIRQIVDNREYVGKNHIPKKRIDVKGEIYLSSIFSALFNSGVFVAGLQKSIIMPNSKYMELIRRIADDGQKISIAPLATGGRDNVNFYTYCSNIKNGILEIIPEVPITTEEIDNTDTQNIYNYLFGVEQPQSYIQEKYFANECFGIYRIFYPIQWLAITKVYLQNKELGENLFAFTKQHTPYTENLRENRLMIEMPFANRDFISLNELTQEDSSLNEFEYFSPEWFRAKSVEFPTCDTEAGEILSEFNQHFSVEKLSSLTGKDVLTTIFLNPENKTNLQHLLEYGRNCVQIFGSISGTASSKYGFYYSKSDNSWTIGTQSKKRLLAEEEAIVEGTRIRDLLVNGAKEISNYGEIKTLDDYIELYKKVRDITEGNVDKIWFMKYYQMLFPYTFSTTYSYNAQEKLLTAIGENIESGSLVRMGQMRLFADKCGITPVMLGQIFWKYYTDESADSDEDEAEKVSAPVKYYTKYVPTKPFSRNRILFGAPGTGKSHTLNKEQNELLKDGGEYERVTFHPDYSYANFVGTYKPVPSKDNNSNDTITYSYVPGPFMRTYVKALRNSREDVVYPFLLLIEEINRANVAAVFGDVFQLLDRDEEEKSQYPIQASEDIKKYLAKVLDGENGNPEDYAEIRIPDNMFIWATMNSADQGVFPMDTAFKRRWDFKYLGIDDSEEGIKGKIVTLGTGEYERKVEWNALRKAINEELLTYKVNEDKLMGPYFLSKKVIPEKEPIDASKFIEVFKNKVIMYLFDDAARQKRHSLFSGCDEKTRTQYSKICAEFDKRGIAIFSKNITDKIIPLEQGEE